jgi:cytochrome c
MKKVTVAAVLALSILACNSKKETPTQEVVAPTTSEESATNGPEIQGPFQKGADLIAASDCLSCHKVDEKVVGPSYKDVAAKYTEKDAAMLAEKIIKGGQGNWGEIPMTPHPTVSVADATEMVNYILSLN